MNGITQTQQSAITNVARAIGIIPEWLYVLVKHESNFDPQAKNPDSSARGLLQWTNARARELGFAGSLDLITKYPTFSVQMHGPVYQELLRGGPYPTVQSLFMYIFYPAARDWPPDKSFPDTIFNGVEWVPWTSLNPYTTPGEYVRGAYEFAGLQYTPEKNGARPRRGGLVVVLLAAGWLVYTLYKKG